MGHAPGVPVYERYYQNQTPATEVAAEFLCKPSDAELVQAVSHISFTRDAKAPVSLTPEQRATLMKENPDISAAQRDFA